MSDLPTKYYPPSFVQRLIADAEAEQAGAMPEDSSAVRQKGDAMSETERLTTHAWELASEEADRVLAEYRKRWPR